MRYQQTLSHTEELISPTYEIGILLLCRTDEMLSRPYEITTLLKSYGGVSKSSV